MATMTAEKSSVGVPVRASGLAISMLVMAVSVSGPSGCAQQIVEERVYEAPSEFLLGPEDLLEINVWKNQDLTRTVVIRPDGLISLPIIGDVQAAGLSANKLSDQIAQRLKKLITNPLVSVSVKEINSYAIFVVGEVAKPGKYTLKSFTTVLDAISIAGGFTEFARRNSLQVVRKLVNGDGKFHEIHIPVRYDNLVAGRDIAGNFVLTSGDTLVVP